MIDPVLSDSILLAAMAGALIVVFGALFAVLFAFARLKNNRPLMQLAYVTWVRYDYIKLKSYLTPLLLLKFKLF